MTVVVTGVAGFIGYHVARALLARGQRVLGVDNLNSYYDVGLKEARLATLEGTPGFVFSRLDIAVTTPGLNIRKTILDYTEEDLDRVVNLNIKGTVDFMRAFGRIMVDQRGGSLIACSSVRAVTIEPGLAVYGCTKAAIGLLVKGFASEVGGFGVRVNAIAPSIAETALTAPFKQRPDIHKLYAAHTVFNRWSSSDEVAAAVAFLASDASSYVSGSTLFVDGGWTAIDGPPTGLTQFAAGVR